MTRKAILAAMVGLAMLAMPVRTLAGDHDHSDWDDNERPQAWHDQGWNNGWFNNPDRNDYQPGQYGNYYQAPAGHHEPDRDDGYGYYPRAWHHEPYEDDYSCDEDGDDCQPVSPSYDDYSCDEDGDDCRPVYARQLEPRLQLYLYRVQTPR